MLEVGSFHETRELKEKFYQLDRATQKDLVIEIGSKWDNPEYTRHTSSNAPCA